MKYLAWILSCLLMLMAGFAYAQPGDGKPPPMPPQEAFSVCTDKKAGDQVTIKVGDRTMIATCEIFPGTGELAARPSEAPPQKNSE